MTAAGWARGARARCRWTARPWATGRIERTLPFRISLDETLDCGEDTGTPVSEDYHVPFTFTGELMQAVVKLPSAQK